MYYTAEVTKIENHVSTKKFELAINNLYRHLKSKWWLKDLEEYTEEYIIDLRNDMFTSRANDLFYLNGFNTRVYSENSLASWFIGKRDVCKEHYYPRKISMERLFIVFEQGLIKSKLELINWLIHNEVFFTHNVTSKENELLKPFQTSSVFISPYDSYTSANLMDKMHFLDDFYNSWTSKYSSDILDCAMEHLGYDKCQEIVNNYING